MDDKAEAEPNIALAKFYHRENLEWISNQWRMQVERPPTDQNILDFIQFFMKTWQVCMLAPLLEGRCPLPPSGESCIRPL